MYILPLDGSLLLTPSVNNLLVFILIESPPFVNLTLSGVGRRPLRVFSLDKLILELSTASYVLDFL